MLYHLSYTHMWAMGFEPMTFSLEYILAVINLNKLCHNIFTLSFFELGKMDVQDSFFCRMEGLYPSIFPHMVNIPSFHYKSWFCCTHPLRYNYSFIVGSIISYFCIALYMIANGLKSSPPNIALQIEGEKPDTRPMFSLATVS